MEFATAIVHLGGNLNMGVPKADLSPAEVLVLLHIHGEGSVVQVYPTGEKDRSSSEEMARLQAIYGDTGAMDRPDRDRVPVLSHLFPGARPQLPVKFADVGIDVGEVLEAPKPAATAPTIAVEEDEDDKPADPFDHDGDGQPGGSLPGEQSTVKRGRGRPRKDAE